MNTVRVLIIVDVQKDFCPGGSLAVAEGDKVVPVINELIARGGFDLIIATRDFHPSNHCSYVTNHPGKQVFSQVEVNGLSQTLWPRHCEQGTPGAEFHDGLATRRINYVVDKGTDASVDSYSGFFDNGKRNQTKMLSILDAELSTRGLTRSDLELFICGLATDYCVAATARDALLLGLNTSVLIDAARAVNLDPKDEEHALREIIAHGGKVVESKELLSQLPLRPTLEPDVRGISLGA